MVILQIEGVGGGGDGVLGNCVNIVMIPETVDAMEIMGKGLCNGP